MNKKFNTVILAGGEGSRMKELSEKNGLPKHLLPLGNENITSRLIRQSRDFSDRIICVVNPEKKIFLNQTFHPMCKLLKKRIMQEKRSRHFKLV